MKNCENCSHLDGGSEEGHPWEDCKLGHWEDSDCVGDSYYRDNCPDWESLDDFIKEIDAYYDDLAIKMGFKK